MTTRNRRGGQQPSVVSWFGFCSLPDVQGKTPSGSQGSDSLPVKQPSETHD
jgi:hypothetical protein